MKILCSCGAKYEFELTPAMAANPVKFVCPACGLDSSEFVDGLVRRELGQNSAPAGVPVSIVASASGARRAAPLRVQPAQVSSSGTEGAAEAADAGPPLCRKHPGEVASEKCYICSKPICPKCMELFGYVCSPLCKAKAEARGITLPVYERQRDVLEARRWHKVVVTSGAIGTVLAIVLGLWIWYAWFGSKPKVVFSVRFPQPAYSGQSVICGPAKDQLVFLHGDTLARYDLKTKRQIWSCSLLDRNKLNEQVDAYMAALQQRNARLRDQGAEEIPRIPPPEKILAELQLAAEQQLTLHVRGQNIWVAWPDRLVRYDWESGRPANQLEARSGGIVARGDELLEIDQQDSRTAVTHVDLATGETRNETVVAPEAEAMAASSRTGLVAGVEKQGGTSGASGGGKSMDPAKLAEQAQRLSLPSKIALPAMLANTMRQERIMAELNDSGVKPTTPGLKPGPSSVSLIPTRDGLVEFGVELVEERIVERSAMKPAPARSILDGNLTAGNSLEASAEMLNEMQRARGGDIVQEDMSRYQVALRAPGTKEAWTGEVVGPPKLFPLQTVNVLTANKLIMVFDKSNKKLWQSALSYNVVGGLGSLDAQSARYGQGPCVERNGSLYLFDEGVLTAFDLPTGNARWRLPSVGITGLFFDDKDNLYVNTTTASHDTLKYSRQIDLNQNVSSIVLKLDSKNGTVLWRANVGGLISYVSGKFIFAVDAYQPSDEDEDSPLGDLAPQKGPHLRIRRINPRNGSEIWEHYEERAPLDIAFDQNVIRLLFKREVEVLRFLSF